MIKTIFPTQDTTIYNTTASMNTGIDEILELTKVISGSTGALKRSRALLQFDFSEISSSLAARGITTSSDAGNLRYFLKMYIAQEKDVPNDYSISIHPLRSSWVGGLGRSTNVPVTEEGCSWTYRDGVTAGTTWADAGGYFITGAEPLPVAKSIFSQSYTNIEGDIEVDITSFVHRTLNGTFENNGLIVKRSGSQETDSSEYGTLQYFSRETNTIFPPRIEARFNSTTDTTRVTGSMATASADDLLTVTALTFPEYKRDTETRIELDIQPKFPVRSQGLQASATTRYSLPTGSTYAICDQATGEKIIPHTTTGSLIACNNKHFIDVDMSSLFPERYYTIQIKVPDLLFNGSEQYFDTDTYFKVVK